MGKIILYIAQSIDGFIADENGEVEWLNKYGQPDEDYGYTSFYANLSAVIAGSKTYEQAIGFNFWYKDIESYVFTTRQLPVPEGWNPVFCQGDPLPLVKELRNRDKDSWLVGGASLVTTFLNAGLIDELILSIIPEILCKGIPLFNNISQTHTLQLLENKGFKDGIVHLRYSINS